MGIDGLVKQLEKELIPRLKGKISIVGVGNSFRGDDGVGPEIINKLKGKIQAELYNCGEAPENYLEKIVGGKPNTLVIIDSARMNQPPGSLKILNVDEIKQFGLSTHSLSLKLFIDYIKKDRAGDIFVLAIQPKSLKLGEGLSKEVKRSLEAIEKVFIEKFPLRS